MKGYIWRREWAWPYESAWGILEKFKYANALDNQVFKELLNLRNPSPSPFFSKELFMYSNATVDNELFYSSFDIQRSHFSCLNVFLGNTPNVVFREHLYCCPKCMELGYHSYWHQIKMITRCPFHGKKLKKASYNKQTISYSIFTLKTGAFSSMKNTTTIPAERFAQILPSRILIDGPWDNSCENITFPQISFDRLIFYTPFFDSRGIMKLPQDATYNFMCKLLVNESANTAPAIKISLEECDKGLSSIIKQAQKWFESKIMRYNHHQVNDWYTMSLINGLIAPYEAKEIDDAIYKLRHMWIDGCKPTDRFIEVASALLTGYTVSDSRTIEEAIDYSLITHPTTHSISRCKFSLYEMEEFTVPDSRIHKYINYLIYLRLFNLLHTHIKQLLTQSKDLNFEYQDINSFNIPDYVITLKNSFYEIYEFYRED